MRGLRGKLGEADLQDACLVVATVLISVGAAWVYPPAGLIAPGVILLALALWRM